ncbi:hypothetical protein FHS77_001173 [Paenochrobactrum gallinarii]|uniref:Uncharacterized protein n=1 Tax=Paenochrobactrum gallinarii TaxID=643673 RepID=A0A841LYE3_9HYPH|nr:hypothetical protein [Paenochrobactrum gallinarii]MBB6260639.1 hypothetical protein [Paenochrobactrum gallinarii]
MADITHGRWIERKGQMEMGRMSGHRTFKTTRSHSHATNAPQKTQTIHPATVFLGIMLCGLAAPAVILIWSISKASLNLFN